MKRQLRIIIGENNNSSFAVKCADAFRAEGEWAVTRRQTPSILLNAIKTEHPDAVILDTSSENMHFAYFVKSVQMITDIALISVSQTENDIQQQLSLAGIHCFPLPESLNELVAQVRQLCSSVRASAPAVPVRFDENAKLSDMLQNCGIPANLRGFHYLHCAVLIAADQPVCGRKITKTVYPAVAQKFGATACGVERSIRHALLQGWENADLYADQPNMPLVNKRMTNSEFIAYAVEWLKRERSIHVLQMHRCMITP